MRRTWLISDISRMDGVISADNAAIAATTAAITAGELFVST